MDKGKILIGSALILSLSTVMAIVTHEVKEKKQQDNEIIDKERMYKIDFGDNEYFGYDCEEYSCNKDTNKELELIDDYHNYSKE